MRTNERGRQWRSAAVCALAALALTSGTALAAIPATTAYHFSSHPMISGTVVTVNDHQMVVDTDQGEQVALEVDSRTMAPRDLAPGMVLRVEFLALDNCRFYAQRIMAIRSGMSLDRLQAYANTRDERMARDATAFDGYRWDNGRPSIAGIEDRERTPQAMGEHSSGTVMTATPGTADDRFSTRPMMSGRVVTVNDHRLVVETDQGQQVGLVMDSRTMVPGEVAPGTVIRAEFSRMEDGRYYAKRIGRIGSGSADREQAYAHTRDSDMALAQNTSDCGFESASRHAVTSALDRRKAIWTPASVVALSAQAPVVERPEMLPQTASNQPLLLLLGLFALGSAGVLAVARGLRVV